MYRNFGLCNFQLSTKHQTTSLSGLLHEKASRWIDIFTLRKAVKTAEIVLFWATGELDFGLNYEEIDSLYKH
jgi:hypothetical protein